MASIIQYAARAAGAEVTIELIREAMAMDVSESAMILTISDLLNIHDKLHPKKE